MADRSDRFRRLRGARTGNLFEHFGIELEAPPPAIEAADPLEASLCRHCTWIVPYRRDEPTCPVCGDPDPIAPAQKNTRR